MNIPATELKARELPYTPSTQLDPSIVQLRRSLTELEPGSADYFVLDTSFIESDRSIAKILGLLQSGARIAATTDVAAELRNIKYEQREGAFKNSNVAKQNIETILERISSDGLLFELESETTDEDALLRNLCGALSKTLAYEFVESGFGDFYRDLNDILQQHEDYPTMKYHSGKERAQCKSDIARDVVGYLLKNRYVSFRSGIGKINPEVHQGAFRARLRNASSDLKRKVTAVIDSIEQEHPEYGIDFRTPPCHWRKDFESRVEQILEELATDILYGISKNEAAAKTERKFKNHTEVDRGLVRLAYSLIPCTPCSGIYYDNDTEDESLETTQWGTEKVVKLFDYLDIQGNEYSGEPRVVLLSRDKDLRQILELRQVTTIDEDLAMGRLLDREPTSFRGRYPSASTQHSLNTV